MQVRVQSFGRFLSAMVMPNIGAFIAWGLLTALFIDTGWLPNAQLSTIVGNNDDLIEANDLAARGIIDPAIMVTHVGGIDSIAETTCNLPNIKGGKKLAYTQFNMPMTAIEDFGKLGETDPFFKELDACCKAHNGLWNPEAEKLIFEHFGVTVGL